MQPECNTDFVVIGLAEVGSHDFCYALLDRLHNPRRNLLQPVLLTSNNKSVTDFVLVETETEIRPVVEDALSMAAWLRNHRCTSRGSPRTDGLSSNNKRLSDFVLVENDEGNHHAIEDALSMAAWLRNHRRGVFSTPSTAGLFSNNKKENQFILVGAPIPGRRQTGNQKKPKHTPKQPRGERSSNDSVMEIELG